MLGFGREGVVEEEEEEEEEEEGVFNSFVKKGSVLIDGPFLIFKGRKHDDSRQ